MLSKIKKERDTNRDLQTNRHRNWERHKQTKQREIHTESYKQTDTETERGSLNVASVVVTVQTKTPFKSFFQNYVERGMP